MDQKPARGWHRLEPRGAHDARKRGWLINMRLGTLSEATLDMMNWLSFELPVLGVVHSCSFCSSF